MKIRSSRIDARLRTQGFVMHQTNGTIPSFGFVRPDSTPDLYQQIVVSFGGRQAEVVDAEIALSTLRWTRLRGLSERRPLKEVAHEQERCWTKIAGDAQARDWEDLLVRVAPAKLEEFAGPKRDELLARTASVRQRAQVHLKRLDPRQSVANQIYAFERTTPSALFAEAERLAGAVGVMQLSKTAEVYMLSCLAILSAPGGYEFIGQHPLRNDDLMRQFQPGADEFIGQHPLRNDDLMRQIQLVADGILSWDQNRELLKV